MAVLTQWRRRPTAGRRKLVMCLLMEGGRWRTYFFVDGNLRGLIKGLVGVKGNPGTGDRTGEGFLKREGFVGMSGYGAGHIVLGGLLVTYLFEKGAARTKGIPKLRVTGPAMSPGYCHGRDRPRGYISRTNLSSRRGDKK